MNTQTHLLIACALLARPTDGGGARTRNAAVVAGALAPDAGVYGLYAWSKLAGVPERDVWRSIYFAEPMQTIQAVLNSVPLYALVLIAAAVLLAPGRAAAAGATGAVPGGAEPAGGVTTGWRRFVAGRSALGLFALAALLHLAGDVPVHADDAHRHFWPLTDWRFHSPVSYWNPSQGGDWFAFVEAALGVACAIVLWRRFRVVWVRALLGLAIAAYIAVPLYFTLVLGGG